MLAYSGGYGWQLGLEISREDTSPGATARVVLVIDALLPAAAAPAPHAVVRYTYNAAAYPNALPAHGPPWAGGPPAPLGLQQGFAVAACVPGVRGRSGGGGASSRVELLVLPGAVDMWQALAELGLHDGVTICCDVGNIQ